MKTQEQHQQELAMTLSEEFTSQLIDTNIELIYAIEAEEYETAAILRDNLKVLIETITFNVTNILGINEDILRKHYNEQNQLAFNQLKEAYEKY